LSRNAFGFSTAFSNTVEILTAILPDAPINVANNALVTRAGKIGLSWQQGAYDGGSPIIDYRISMKKSPAEYSVLASNVIPTSYSAENLVADGVYTFKIEARNLLGFSGFSEEIQIIAAAVPDQPAMPVTTVISNTDVTFTWTAPYDGGSPIIGYLIKIRHSDNTTFTTNANCDGKNSLIL
jgi:hypothetical protein